MNEKNYFNVALMVAAALIYAFINYATEKPDACATISFLNSFCRYAFTRLATRIKKYEFAKQLIRTPLVELEYDSKKKLSDVPL